MRSQAYAAQKLVLLRAAKMMNLSSGAGDRQKAASLFAKNRQDVFAEKLPRGILF
jgi:hypothetical protein